MRSHLPTWKWRNHPSHIYLAVSTFDSWRSSRRCTANRLDQRSDLYGRARAMGYSLSHESLFDKPRSHHQMSHNQTKMIDDLLKVDQFHMEQFTYIAERLDSIEMPEGNTLLDQTLLTYGSGLGDGSTHQYNDLPIIVAGVKQASPKTPHQSSRGHSPANLPPQANLCGLPIQQFADSSGVIKDLLA